MRRSRAAELVSMALKSGLSSPHLNPTGWRLIWFGTLATAMFAAASPVAANDPQEAIKSARACVSERVPALGQTGFDKGDIQNWLACQVIRREVEDLVSNNSGKSSAPETMRSGAR